ncbi:NADH-quinone oxidoreductase subunit G [Alkalilimnicola ehrlichii]|uniref:NADH-quinone oxidoreductase n=1 Tax=Alkalilimnicola ehrlichii TaxID=351052 RepID=A0A3E0WYQ4_9GAMM|nr:NADH-quinone oxidoreductase subunit NuoG [Alkalilimnicola ehrlichii]RFA30574.1 NADH-quinone oxidoreductase subunit G [Alkalilimnicola ehrlichii]RFA38124.1 NADH-quinone oxidoreductase subunit G [Alkalilimnicola ehrlichii]
MNAKVDQEQKNPDLVTIEVDGVSMEVRKGAMLIEATDAANVHVPRFCYHKKLSVAANCRMCLVEVERAPKPLPACATPVADGMRVFTKSERALAAQKGVMEFLLINHPLDCPICDQGGECELQDVALGYGRGVSRFTERKRVVEDENLGPLVATEMTRCIHCTRCVRFLDEVAGQRELGGIGRGEHTVISTYVEAGVRSELSGNVIDLCPVGALTSKPYRFSARAWEMLSHAAIAPHDSVGSNINLHHVRGKVKRVAPRENESLNETWISDRDRFSYQGIYSEDRLPRPLVKRNGEWEEVEWETALEVTAKGLRQVVEAHGGGQLGALISPTSTLEELYLLSRLVRGLGSANIDHRLRQADFSDQAKAPAFPHLGLSVEELEAQRAVLVIGSNVRSELPIINLRLRKASLAGAAVMTVNPRRFKANYELAVDHVVAPQAMVRELAAVAQALLDAKGEPAPAGFAELLGDVKPGRVHQDIATKLQEQEQAVVLTGALVESHPAGAALRALAGLIARLSNARFGQLPQAANSVGACLAGAQPHRGVGARKSDQVGLDARRMFEEPRKGYLLFNVEPEFDAWNPSAARKALAEAEFVAVMSPYATPDMADYADVILPISAFSETAGTYVNLEGRWQSAGGVAAPVGEARPGWRVLRVLGNLFDLDGFDYQGADQVLDEIRSAVGEAAVPAAPAWEPVVNAFQAQGLVRLGDVPIYRTDMLVRRASALQATVHTPAAAVYLAAATAAAVGVREGQQVRVRQDGASLELPAVIDDSIPADCVWIPAALEETGVLGPMQGEVTVEAA